YWQLWLASIKQRCDLFLRPARKAAPDLSDLKCRLADSIQQSSVLHIMLPDLCRSGRCRRSRKGATHGHVTRWDGEAVALRPETLMQDSPVLVTGDLSRPAAMDTLFVAAK